jgi:hypothetical protein
MSRSRIEARDKKNREMDQAALARELTGAGIELLARDPELAQRLAAHALCRHAPDWCNQERAFSSC